jgi:RNA polymerase sigma factor (sigma-70 family)
MKRAEPKPPDDDILDLVREHEGPLMAYARRLLEGDVDGARDIVQEAYLRFFRGGGRGQVDRPASWLFRVCRNLALDTRRKESRMTRLSEASRETLPDRVAGPDRLLEHKEVSHAIVGALRALSDKQQEVLRLKFQGGLTYQEISEVTGYSVTNVGFILHQALRALQGNRRINTQEHAS